MRPTLLQRVDLKLRQALPGLLILLCIMLSVTPLRLPDYALVAPGLVLIAVFYWTVHRPDLLRPWHACLLGLFIDGLDSGRRHEGWLLLLALQCLPYLAALACAHLSGRQPARLTSRSASPAARWPAPPVAPAANGQPLRGERFRSGDHRST